MSHDKKYSSIKPGGGDTGTPLNLQKRLAVIQRYVDVRGKKIIDCGCGSGEYVLALSNLGADVWGIEYDENKVAEFKRSKQQADRVSVGNIEQTNFSDLSFDIALLNEVLEHIPNDRQGLKEIHRILRPQGVLIVLSPNRLYPFETHGVFLNGSTRRIPHYIPFIPYIPLNIGRKIFHYWARNYWPSELRLLVTECGFKVTHVDYIWQTFENISGHQPLLITALKPLLKRICSFCEQIPLVKTFGVSQMIIAEKISARH